MPGALFFLDPTPGYPVAVLAASITSFWIFPFLLKAIGRYNLLAFISIQNLIFCILWSCYYYGGVPAAPGARRKRKARGADVDVSELAAA